MKYTIYIKESGKIFNAMMFLNEKDRLADIIQSNELLNNFYNTIRKNDILLSHWNDNSIFNVMNLSSEDVSYFINHVNEFKSMNIDLKLPTNFYKLKSKVKVEIESKGDGNYTTKIYCDKTPLTNEEYNQLTHDYRSLVFLRGSWVIADSYFVKAYHNQNHSFQGLLESDIDFEFKNDDVFDFKIKNADTFKEHQIKAINKIGNAFKANRNILFADDMGLGKTASTIGFINSMNITKPILIIVPKSLVGNWISEFKKFAPNLICNELKETDKIIGNSIYVTTYGNVLHNYESIMNVLFDVVILDEAQQIKNYKTKISKIICNIKACHKLALTGTPIENSVKDLWSLFQFLHPGLLGDVSRFESNIGNINQFDKVIKLLSPYIIRRMKADTKDLNLPTKNEIKVNIELSDDEKLLYNSIIDRFQLEKKSATKTTILKYLNHLKITCGMASNIFNVTMIPSKLLKLEELIIKSNYSKFVVFTQFVETANKIKKYLENVYNKQGIVIDGSLSAKQRTEIANDFQHGKYAFIVLTLKSGNCGLTLTESCNLVHYDRWWNPAVENQATDRIYRIGQKKDCNIYKFIANNSIESNIDKILDDKNLLFNNVVNVFIENKNLIKRI